MRKKWIIGVIILLAMGCLSVIGLKLATNPKSVIKDNNTTVLNGNLISFRAFGADDFSCTGLTWDEKDNAFWIGDYGAKSIDDTPSPRVVEVNKDLTEVLRIIDLTGVISSNDNLQGVAYDQSNDSLWLAVGDTCKNIDKDGKLLSEFSLGKFSKYKSNGICVDDGTLWVLCYSKYLLHYDKAGNLIEENRFNYKNQDQICIHDGMLLATVGADYNGDGNYVMVIDRITGKTLVKYQTIGAYAVEGICVVDGKMYIANDGLYHNAKIKESYISVFDIR